MQNGSAPVVVYTIGLHYVGRAALHENGFTLKGHPKHFRIWRDSITQERTSEKLMNFQ